MTALTRDELIAHINDMHIDDLDVEITAVPGGFAVCEHRGGPYVSDIGSSYEVPDHADEHGRVRFTAGPFDAYQYHGSYLAPHRDNYEQLLDDLAAGDVKKLVVGYGGLEDTWVFGIREAR